MSDWKREEWGKKKKSLKKSLNLKCSQLLKITLAALFQSALGQHEPRPRL